MTDLLSINSTTGKVNVRPGVKPNFADLNLHGADVEAPAAQPVWLMASFGSAGGGEGLSVAASYDLVEWTSLSTATAAKGIRDPQLIFYRGQWYCFYTQGNSSRVHLEFGFLSSPDLIHWTDHTITLSAAHFANGSQEIWQPIPALDANGDLYVIALATTDPEIFTLRPTNPDDLTTLDFSSAVTMTYGAHQPITPQSAQCVAGTYYIGGMEGSPQTRRLYSATSVTGPYTLAGTIDAWGPQDALSLFADRDGTWVGCANFVSPYAPAFRSSAGGYSAFGDLQPGFYRPLAGAPLFGYINPSIQRCYGAAAISARLAMQQVVDSAPATPIHSLLPQASVSTTAANGGHVDVDSGLWNAWNCNTGTTAGGQATVTVSTNIHYNVYLGNVTLIGSNRHLPFDFRAKFIYGNNDSNSPAKILFGVKPDHLGDLDHAGVGLRFKSVQHGTGTVELLVHDGTSQSAVLSAPFTPGPSSGLTEVRVVIWRESMAVWINYSLTFVYGNVPTVAASAINDWAYNCIGFEADYGGSGGGANHVFFAGELRVFEK